jgi:hypothetical protein
MSLILKSSVCCSKFFNKSPFPHLFPLTCNSVQKYAGFKIKNESHFFCPIVLGCKRAAPFNPNSSASENKIIISFYVLFSVQEGANAF